MKTKSLIDTNPYLKDPATRKMLVARSVKTSGNVEGIDIPPADANVNIEIPRRGNKKIYQVK